MNEMRATLKQELPYLYSKLLKACALFGCGHISGYIKLSLFHLTLRISTTSPTLTIISGHASASTFICCIFLFCVIHCYRCGANFPKKRKKAGQKIGTVVSGDNLCKNAYHNSCICLDGRLKDREIQNNMKKSKKYQLKISKPR